MTTYCPFPYPLVGGCLIRYAVATVVALLVSPGVAQAHGLFNYSSATPTNHRFVWQAANARAKTYKYEQAMGHARSPYPGLSLWRRTLSGRLHFRDLWRQRARDAVHTWRVKTAGLRCIHTHEGAWNDNTGNGYYGGLQMDISFQDHWGRFILHHQGTANRWSPFDQIRVAYKAVRSIGYGPWPNTRRMCGI